MIETKKSVCVIGLGYIGLPTAAVLASRDYKVLGVDINPRILECIEKGTAHIEEPSLDKLIESGVSKDGFKAFLHPAPSDVYIIAVPTPFNMDKSPDISWVEAAFDSIAPYIKEGDLIILESTCPAGTTEAMSRRLQAIRTDLCFPSPNNERANIYMAYCPERVLPGNIVKELIENDRVVGGVTARCTIKAIEFYKGFVKGECLATDSKTAEMCKLAENSFRDVNIAFANELSMICDQAGINVKDLIKLANHHPRVNILKPGPGVGGHCIAVDPWFLIHCSSDLSKLIYTARKVNERKTSWVIKKILDKNNEFIEKNKKEPVVSLFGVSYKENVSDIRESPALQIVNTLGDVLNKKIFVVDPVVKNISNCFKNPNVTLCGLESAICMSDIVIKLVNHVEFMNLSERIRDDCVVLDFC